MTICLLLAVLTFAAFDLILDNGFILYDDPGYVTENTHVLQGLTPDSITWAFHTTFTGNWIPVTWLTHMLDVELYGVNPRGHHLDNLILHTCNVILVFVFLQTTTQKTWASAIVAVLFAIHPLRVESVAWVAERKDVLSGFWGLWACLCYVFYTRQTTRRKRFLFYCLTFILLTLGLMSKAMLVTWPFVFLLLDFWPLKRFHQSSWLRLENTPSNQKDSRLLIEKVPFLILAVFFSAIAYYAQHQQGAVQTFESSPLNLRLENVIVSYGRYLTKSFWPSHLALLYPLNLDILAVSNIVLSVLVLLIISILCLAWKNKKPYLLTGWLWFLGTLVPVIGLVQIGSQSIADRYTYLPSIGLSVMVAFGLCEFLSKRKILRVIGMTLLAGTVFAMLLLTWIQCAYWKNSFTIFRHTIQATECNYIMQMNYAYAFFQAGQYDEATQEYQRAEQLRPTSSEPFAKLGEICIRQGRCEQAIAYFLKAVELNKDVKLHEVYNNIGVALAKQKQYAEAISYFEKSLQFDPQNGETLANAASSYRDNHQYHQAIICLQKALAIEPNVPGNLNKLAQILLIEDSETYDPHAAIENAQKACQLTGFQKPQFLETLAKAYLAAGELDQALDCVNNALNLIPSEEQADLGDRLQALQQGIHVEKNRK